MRILTTLLFTLHLLGACGQKSITSKEILASLAGNFDWEIIRPSTSEVLRSGSKVSSYELDSLVLFSRESFNDSQIEQVAFFGYRTSDSLFFSIGLYNQDIGPHISYGRLNTELRRITFTDSDSTKFYLNLIDDNCYYWTYEQLTSGVWKKRDMIITFKRSE